MLGKRIINTATGAAPSSCTTDTVQILGDTSCVAYYKMSDATDETGSYDGTPTNVNFNVAGKFGNAGEFNGSSSKIDLPNFMPSGNASRSVSMWIKTTQTTAATLFQYGGGGTNLLFNFRINDGGAGGGANTIGIGFYANDFNRPATGLMDGNWHHVAATYDGTNAKIYIDGSQIGADFATGGVNTTATTALIGSNGGTFILNGSIDQVRIFDRAITAGEVTKLYNEVYCQPTIVPTDHFEPVIYTGNGTTQSITSLDFQPDWVWVKNRDSAGENHLLSDVVSGFGKVLFSNLTNAQIGSDNTYFSQLPNGFSINTNNGNVNANNYVAWNWKAGGAAVSNTDGTITSQVSANTDAGFSIVSYTGNGVTPSTYGHGLSETPKVVIVKNRDASTDWMFNFDLTPTNALLGWMNKTDSMSRSTWMGGTDSVVSILFDTQNIHNTNGNDYIAYCFAEVDGMSKFGSYVGVGSGNTVNVVTGFRPAMIIIKRTDSIEDWKIIDNKRDFANSLEPNGSITEEVGNNSNFSSHSNGFTIGDPHGDYNASGGTYIFMAFAEEVFVPDNFFNDDSTVATYKLNGDAGDDSGNEYNGTASNITYAAGKFDDAAVFNGSSSVINLSSSPLDITTDFTISGWLNHESSGVNLFLFACTDTNTNNIHFDLNLQSTQNRVELVYNNVAYYIPLTYQSGWHFYAVTLTGTSLQIYRNGSLFNTQTVTVASSSGNRQTIGTRLRQSYSSYGSGKLDQVRIFDKALDSGEVTQLYNE